MTRLRFAMRISLLLSGVLMLGSAGAFAAPALESRRAEALRAVWREGIAGGFVPGGVMLVLSDGTVMCKTYAGGTDGIGNTWDRLTPDANGSYIAGTWSAMAPMYDTRLYFSSQVLMDGRVYVAGGIEADAAVAVAGVGALKALWLSAEREGG